jgi:hypothetical protein
MTAADNGMVVSQMNRVMRDIVARHREIRFQVREGQRPFVTSGKQPESSDISNPPKVFCRFQSWRERV